MVKVYKFIKDVYNKKVFVGKYSNLGIWISKVNSRTITNLSQIQKNIGSNNLFLNEKTKLINY